MINLKTLVGDEVALTARLLQAASSNEYVDQIISTASNHTIMGYTMLTDLGVYAVVVRAERSGMVHVTTGTAGESVKDFDDPSFMAERAQNAHRVIDGLVPLASVAGVTQAYRTGDQFAGETVHG